MKPPEPTEENNGENQESQRAVESAKKKSICHKTRSIFWPSIHSNTSLLDNYIK
jgi:hypothetical protein